MEYNGEDIRKAQMEQRMRILKSFGETDLFSGVGDSNELMRSMEKAEENDIEKAKHQDGDMHPNGRWVWRQSANGGKGDWRVANPKRGGGSRAAASTAKTTSSEGDSGKTTGEPNEKSWGKIKEFATKTKKVFVARDNGVDCPAIRITGDKTYAQKVIKEMNEYCGTNYSISDFERYPKTRYSDNSYEAYVNIHNGKLYSSEKEAKASVAESKENQKSGDKTNSREGDKTTSSGDVEKRANDFLAKHSGEFADWLRWENDEDYDEKTLSKFKQLVKDGWEFGRAFDWKKEEVAKEYVDEMKAKGYKVQEVDDGSDTYQYLIKKVKKSTGDFDALSSAKTQLEVNKFWSNLLTLNSGKGQNIAGKLLDSMKESGYRNLSGGMTASGKEVYTYSNKDADKNIKILPAIDGIVVKTNDKREVLKVSDFKSVSDFKKKFEKTVLGLVGNSSDKKNDSGSKTYASDSADAYDRGDGKIGNYPVPTKNVSLSGKTLYSKLNNNRHFGFKYGMPSKEIMEKLKNYSGNVKYSYHNNAGTNEIYRIEFM